ncbi:ankyrin repeat-containing domain protein [Neocallimastix lanati (nom. inval.)]|nr:ankyrin repeat-containing domain protein [Neocallimastix sp. JGI-2020a]
MPFNSTALKANNYSILKFFLNNVTTSNIQIISQYLLDVDPNVNLENNHGNVLLNIALKNGYLEIIEDLLKHGADINYKKYNETAKYLINNGGDENPDMIYTVIPLIISSAWKILKDVEKGANINDTDGRSNSVLNTAF